MDVEFLILSAHTRSISWIKRDGVAVNPGPVSLQWYSNFWIYLIMFIYMAALLSGMYHFSTIKNPDDLYRNGVFSRDVFNPKLHYVSSPLLSYPIG
jgi:hypothetical protein